MPLREAQIPPDSRVAAIIRGDQVVIPRGDETIKTGDRIVVIGSPQAAQAWSALIMPGTSKVTDVVIFGAGRAGTAIARLLLEQGIGVRLIEASRERARLVAAELPDARVYNATGLDPDFLERERIADAQVAIFAMRDDMKNHFAAALAKVHGRGSRSRSSTSRRRSRCSSTRGSTSLSTRARSRPRRSSASPTTRARSRW